MPLTFFVCLATWAGYRYFAEDCQKKGWLYLLYGCSALAFLTKGLIGVVFPFAIMILWLLISKRLRGVLRLFSPVGIILFLLISCPWIILVQKANKDFLWFFFIHEHFLRYTATQHTRSHTILFYIPIVLFGTLPWSAFLMKALKGGVDKGVPLFKASEKHFLLIWIIFIFIFFSISSSKLIPYIAPVFLPIAVFCGHLFRLYEDRNMILKEGRGRRFLYDLPIIFQSFMFTALILSPFFIRNLKLSKYVENSQVEKWGWLLIVPILLQVMLIFLPSLIKRRWGKGWFLTVTILSALFLVSIHFPITHFLTPYKSAYPISKAIRALLPPNYEVYQFRTSLYGIEFYNKIRTPLVDAIGELGFGFRHLPPDERSHYYLSPEAFYQRCKGNGDIYCVTRHKTNVEALKSGVSVLEILWDNGEFYLLRLRC